MNGLCTSLTIIGVSGEGEVDFLGREMQFFCVIFHILRVIACIIFKPTYFQEKMAESVLTNTWFMLHR